MQNWSDGLGVQSSDKAFAFNFLNNGLGVQSSQKKNLKTFVFNNLVVFSYILQKLAVLSLLKYEAGLLVKYSEKIKKLLEK